MLLETHNLPIALVHLLQHFLHGKKFFHPLPAILAIQRYLIHTTASNGKGDGRRHLCRHAQTTLLVLGYE